jgi:hypothetical protein
MFGFSSSPINSGDLILKFLIPNNDTAPATLSITGTSSGTATLHAGTWTSGDLEAFLGIANASPANPIGAYLPSTQAVDPGATGFSVLTFNAGQYSLPLPSATGQTLPDVFQVAGFTAPAGSYALADLILANGSDVATASSGALFVASSVPEPQTWAMMLLGFVGLAFAFRQSRRKVALA